MKKKHVTTKKIYIFICVAFVIFIAAIGTEIVKNNNKSIPQQYIEYVQEFNNEWSYHPESLKIYSDLYVTKGYDVDKEKEFYYLWFEVSGKNSLGEEVDPYGNMIFCYVNEGVTFVSDKYVSGYKDLEELYNSTGKIIWSDGTESRIMCYDGQQLAKQIGCNFVIKN